MGTVNFSNDFIPGEQPGIAHPLYDVLRGRKPRREVDWSAAGAAAFAALASCDPSLNAPIAITIDASDEQWVDGVWQRLAFFRR